MVFGIEWQAKMVAKCCLDAGLRGDEVCLFQPVENNLASRPRPLKAHRDFVRLQKCGRKVHINSWLMMNFGSTLENQSRFGWTISRQIGSAVVRNRLRRWGREYLRNTKISGKAAWDVNLIFKRMESGFYKAISHEEFDAAMEKLVARLARLP
jgi:ribonuclease P protein component